MHIRACVLVAASLLLLTLSTPALASEGVLEINQTCAVETGCFAGDAAGFPVTIGAPGSFTLTSNLIVPDENTDGILVGTSDVGIDLNNFAIVRSGCELAEPVCSIASGAGSGVGRASFENRGISVRNGSITGMGQNGVSLGEQAEIVNLRVRWNGNDGISTGSGSTVSGNTAYENGRDGIRAGNGSTVSASTVYLNRGNGIFGNSASTISGNTAYQNGINGLSCFDGCAFIHNTAHSNGDTTNPSLDDGIQSANGGCVVRGKSVRMNSGYGLNLGSDSAYGDNVVTGNVTGTVTGNGNANSLGGNYCAGTGAASAACP